MGAQALRLYHTIAKIASSAEKCLELKIIAFSGKMCYTILKTVLRVIMMNVKRIAAAALSLLMTGGAFPAAEGYVPALTAFAEDYTELAEGVLTYHIFPDHAEVGKCQSTAEGEVTIPSQIGGVPVTAIGANAFES